MNIVICEDQEVVLQDIEDRVKNCLNEYLVGEEHHVYTFTTPQELIESLNQQIYDIAYLDIELNEINGIDLGVILKEVNPHCLITFITNYDQYIHDAFILDVVQYLQKPLNDDIFKKVFQKSIKLYKSRNFKLLFHTNKGNTILRTKEILYIETYYRQIKIVTLNETYYTNIKQKESLYKTLKTLNFLKVQRSFIVNMNYISRFTKKSVVLTNNVELPISSLKRESILFQFHIFLFETLPLLEE